MLPVDTRNIDRAGDRTDMQEGFGNTWFLLCTAEQRILIRSRRGGLPRTVDTGFLARCRQFTCFVMDLEVSGESVLALKEAAALLATVFSGVGGGAGAGAGTEMDVVS